jgi:CubicO group peptidase (beta-lactamase class C family)
MAPEGQFQSNQTQRVAMKKSKQNSALILSIMVGLCSVVHPSIASSQTRIDLEQVAQHRSVWPKKDENFPKLAVNSPAFEDQLMRTGQCQSFVEFATGHVDQPNGFNTDQLVVLKNGMIVYEWFSPDTGPDSLHSLWSASKSVSSTLIGAAIARQNLTPQGTRLSEKTLLSDFFAPERRLPLVAKPSAFENFYSRVTIENLLNMTANFKWLEAYDSSLSESTFLPMLYGSGRANMANFALTQPMEPDGPGKRFNYSGGNANLMMAVLAQTAAVNGQNYASLPDDLLFSRLGATRSFFEKDAFGIFVGASYAYMTPYEMARLGYLYLNNGVWNKDRILPRNWVSQALELSEGLKHVAELPPTEVAKFAAYVKDEGVYGNRTLWLNRSVPQIGYANEFKNSPSDMFFAAGHYGQLIIVLPTEDMVIVRTGHDSSYWSKIDALTSGAVNCFANYGVRNDRQFIKK